MSDELVSGLLKDVGFRVALVTAGSLSRQARALHKAESAAAALLSEALMGAALLASQQKEQARINLQVECDGPVRGFFVDAHANGQLRGYVKNPLVRFTGAEGSFQWRPVLGNQGFLSVLRDLGGGEFFRSSVELTQFHFVEDLEHFFRVSEQMPTYLRVEMRGGVVDGQPDALATVVGLLVQPLPDADLEAFAELEASLQERLRGAVAADPNASALHLLKHIFPSPSLEVMSRYPVSFSCTCSRERVKSALLAMGREELSDLLQKEGQAEATCEFCTTHYVINSEEIAALLAASAN